MKGWIGRFYSTHAQHDVLEFVNVFFLGFSWKHDCGQHEAAMYELCPAVLVFTHLLLNGHERVRVTDSNNQTLGSGDGCVEDTGAAQTLGWVIGTS